MLASALEQHGHRSIAGSAYALAYTATRSDWGDPFGGDTHRTLIARATQLDPHTVRQVYADQILTTMRANRGPIDLSADVMHRLSEWGERSAVETAWREVFDVINGRTPQPRLPGRLPRLDRDVLDTDWSLDEVVVALLLARLSDPRVHYKMEALRGFIDAVRRRPDAAARPLAWWLALEHPRTSLVLVLASLIEAEPSPHDVSREIAPHLEALANSQSWLVHRRAHVILERLGMPVQARSVAVNDGAPPPPPSSDPGSRFVGRMGSWRALRNIKDAFRDIVESAERTAYGSLPDAHERGERGQLMWGMRRDAWPATAVILWETEKLFEALDDALARLMRRDTDQAPYDDADPELLEEAMVPDLQFHVGWAASRVARPDWEHPTKIVDDGLVDTLSVVNAENDPAYAGWTRLALIERECPTPAGSYHDARPVRDVTVWAAVVAWPLDRDVPGHAFPFLPCGEIPDMYGPIVAAQREGSWLDDPCRLEPPFSLVWERGLTRSELGEPLVWRDVNGEVAVAVRTWRVVRGDPEAEPAVLEGCDLIARPDMVRDLERLHGDLRELRVTNSDAVPTLSR